MVDFWVVLEGIDGNGASDVVVAIAVVVAIVVVVTAVVGGAGSGSKHFEKNR